MAKVHGFVVEHDGRSDTYEIEAPTQREAVAKLRAVLASKGVTPSKILTSGIVKGSVAATDLNLWVLRDHLAGGKQALPGATARSFPNALAATAKPHIKRCLDAGLCRVAGRDIVLTDVGAARLGVR